MLNGKNILNYKNGNFLQAMLCFSIANWFPNLLDRNVFEREIEMDKVQMKPPLCKSVDSCVSFIQFSHESQIKQTLMSQKNSTK